MELMHKWSAAQKAAYNRNYYRTHKELWEKYQKGSSPGYGKMANMVAQERREAGDTNVPIPGKRSTAKAGPEPSPVPLSPGNETRIHKNYRRAEGFRQEWAAKNAARDKAKSKFERERDRQRQIRQQSAQAKASAARGSASPRAMYDRKAGAEMREAQGLKRAMALRDLRDKSFGSAWRQGAKDIASGSKRIASATKKAASSIASSWKSGAKDLKRVGSSALSSWKSGAKSISSMAKSASSAWKSGASDIKNTAKKATKRGKNLVNSVISRFR